MSLASTDGPLPVGTVVALRLKELRQRSGYTAQAFVQRCAELEATGLTTYVLANIETGRRQATVGELVLFALALEVSPTELLCPAAGQSQAVRVAGETVADAAAFRDWVQNRTEKLGGEHLPSASEAADERAVFQQALGRVVAQFDADAEEMINGMRDEYSGILAEVAARVGDGASATEIVEALDAARVRTARRTRAPGEA
ncbi:helix-turn-helix domain-containing protein [Cryptosporangium sp. NPDC048952]|uniref:helix-turn-helix domain-containing protein n=1 Tax=Cryptosporangium sp. NPDC048952 TaxID=3363961 RepID=UPI003719C3F8